MGLFQARILEWVAISSSRLFLGFSDSRMVKNQPANEADAGDVGSIPETGRSPRERNGNPLQYSQLENPMDRGAWWAAVRRVTESDVTELACTECL